MFTKHSQEQESAPLRFVLPACQPYMLQWPPDVNSGSGGVQGGLMNKFEQVSSDGYQVSLVGGRGWGQGRSWGSPHILCRGGGGGSGGWVPIFYLI